MIRLLGIGSGENGTANGDVGSGSESGGSDGAGLGPFEGLTYCDYGAATATDPVTGEMQGFVCKPQRGMFEKAMREAGVEDSRACYFVGMFCSVCSYPVLHLLLPGLCGGAVELRQSGHFALSELAQPSCSAVPYPHPHLFALPS